MNDTEREKLEVEWAIGQKYQRAWEDTVGPFIEAKQLELYGAFTECRTTDKDGLMAIKLQSNALSALADEFKTFINTGKLAGKQLEENADE